MPEVSVIMSVYNGEPYLKDAIKSVLEQSFMDFEFLIVDDGSRDNSVKTIESFDDPRIKLIRQENTGVARAKNRALEVARGKWTAIIDSDDIWYLSKLEKQLQFLKENPDFVLAGTFSEIIDKDGHFLYIKKEKTDPQKLKEAFEEKNQFMHSSVIFSTSIARNEGGYYEKVRQYFVDYMLLYQISRHGKITNLAEPLIKYRIVPNSLSAKNDPPEFHRIVRNTLKRGSITEDEYQLLQDIKARKNHNPEWRMANYHYYLGRVFLFYRFDRTLAMYHLGQAVRIYPRFKKAWVFYLMSMTMPKGMITWMYRKYFGDSENMLE